MRIRTRKYIKDYITANGASTEAALTEDGIQKGASPERIAKIISRMTRKGRLIKTGDDYSFPA